MDFRSVIGEICEARSLNKLESVMFRLDEAATLDTLPLDIQNSARNVTATLLEHAKGILTSAKAELQKQQEQYDELDRRAHRFLEHTLDQQRATEQRQREAKERGDVIS